MAEEKKPKSKKKEPSKIIKRDYSDFQNFGGEIKDNIYIFPKLEYESKLSQKRFWQIFVRLVEPANPITQIDWDLNIERPLDILQNYFSSSIIVPAYAEYWTETGIENGKTTRNAPTYVTEVTNEGKANEHNVFQTALVKARNEYLKKKERSGNDENNLYYPMLASKEKDNEITFPTFIQHKLNGVRALITLPRRDATVDDVIVYTRQRKLLPNMSALKKELFPYLQQLYQEVSIVLDGELYTHGKPLQEIVSKVRNESIEYEGDYHIFDCFYPDGKEDFEGRWDQIKNLFEVAEELKHTKMMYTKVVYNEQELRQEFKKAIQKDMEGLIVRDPKGLYLTSLKNPGSLRSKQVIKIKNKFSEEYEIVDFKSGTKGKDVGQVIWVIKVGENMIDVVQNIPAAERKRIYEECQKDFTKYKGKMLTVEFEEMSTEGKPLRARGIEIRDYE